MISDELLKTILMKWHPSKTHHKLAITRTAWLPSTLRSDRILAIQGVRRSGKSTFLYHLPQHYDLPLSSCYFCNFEEPDFIGHLTHQLLARIVEIARSEHPENTPCYFFLDEIQYVQNWERFLNVQLELNHHNAFVITGSNASLLSGELGTSLTGRHITIELYPCNFAEFQGFFPHKTITDHLLQGGFPAALLSPTEPEAMAILTGYFQDIIIKDVHVRSAARSSNALMQVAKMIFDTCGSELSLRRIAQATALSVDTVKSYLELFEQAYLILPCPFFSFSEKKQMARNKKYYPIDPALRTAVTNTAGRDLGKSLELLTFLRLKQTHAQVFYFSGEKGSEVDFVTMEGTKITPYQVSLYGMQPRHHQALEHFYTLYPHADEPISIDLNNAENFL